MKFHILTLFPEMIEQAMGHSILKRAIVAGFLEVNWINIRDFANNKHGQIDDAPYGGGAGMVMMAPPIYDAYMSIGLPDAPFVYLSPQGKVLNQSMTKEFALEKDLVLLCGHYEGIDQRLIDYLKPIEISIGNYILTGGELAALVMVDAVARLIPGVVGKNESIDKESFSGLLDGMLEYPHYTRPPIFMEMEVPEILLSGHHAKIEDWRLNQSKVKTAEKRPDLLIL